MASKPVSPRSGVSFTLDPSTYVDEIRDDNAVIAAAAHNNILYVIKENDIFARSGTFGDITGSGYSLTESELVMAGIGSKTEYTPSIITTPAGILFKSNKGGIYQLSQGVKYIGADVEDSSSLTITGAALTQDTQQVRFVTSDGDCLVYDFLAQKWSRFKSYGAVGAGVSQGVFFFGTSDGYVRQESATFDEDGDFAGIKLETNWISLTGIAGYQRVRRVYILGTYKSAHTLRVKVAYDYSSTYAQTSNITAVNDSLYLYRVDLDTQKCTAIKISIEDVESTAQGESLDISGITLEVGAKKGGNKLPSTKQGS